jgi:FlaA1/EpsC-like NDP-sugar epimerase
MGNLKSSNNHLLSTEFASPLFFEKIVGRPESETIDLNEIYNYYSGSKILVAGAGGTIGSAIARRLVLSGCEEVYFLDRDESALHALSLNLSDKAASHWQRCIVADIKDYSGMDAVLGKLNPDVIIHAAALKHLVILERYPREGFNTNVMGTLNLIRAAEANGVKKLINVSTDKAANPISFLGKTKKITELLVAESSQNFQDYACSVRFGNVFASRGSVIETFVHQLSRNLEVTVTDENVARFFMSHNEAANLVLAAGTLNESATFVQNMGDEVLIVDLVKRLAKNLQVDERIIFSGLQPGEKLNEDLIDTDHSDTVFSSIVKLSYEEKSGLREIIEKYGPVINDQDAVLLVENLLRG